MPSGRTHDRITLWSLPFVVGLTLLLTRQASVALVVASSFLFSGLMFGPDLDIYSVQFKRWGRLRTIWLPYQRLLRHRSFFSHGPIIGTTLRIFYLLGLSTLVGMLGVAIAQLIWGFQWNWQQFFGHLIHGIAKNPLLAIALFAGLEWGAMSHSICDWFYSASKRRKGRKKRQRTKRR